MTRGKLVHNLDNGMALIWDATGPGDPELEAEFARAGREATDLAEQVKADLAGLGGSSGDSAASSSTSVAKPASRGRSSKRAASSSRSARAAKTRSS